GGSCWLGGGSSACCVDDGVGGVVGHVRPADGREGGLWRRARPAPRRLPPAPADGRPRSARATPRGGRQGPPTRRRRRAPGRAPQPLSVRDHEALPALDRLAERGIVQPVPEGGERDDPPDPRRLDAAPGAVRLLPLADPALGDLNRAPTERARPAGGPRPAG